MSYDLPILVCDVETTGLSSNQHRLIEMSYARIDKGDWDNFNVVTHRFELSARDYAMGEPRAYAVNGYRRGHPDWRDAPLLDSPEAVARWDEIRRALQDTILMNQKVNFDADFLMAEMNRHSKYAFDEAPWGNRTWDVATFSRAIMKAEKQRGFALHKVYDLVEGPWVPPHRSEADVLRAIWVAAEGMDRFPNLWSDFRIDTGAAREAVRRWSRMRLSAE